MPRMDLDPLNATDRSPQPFQPQPILKIKHLNIVNN